jgi:hypothetical protein
MAAKTQAVEKIPQKTFNVTARVTVDVTIPITAHSFDQAAQIATGLDVDKFVMEVLAAASFKMRSRYK